MGLRFVLHLDLFRPRSSSVPGHSSESTQVDALNHDSLASAGFIELTVRWNSGMFCGAFAFRPADIAGAFVVISEGGALLYRQIS